jgi:hypothetical protein
MAKIYKPELFQWHNFAPGLKRKVGNNRWVSHTIAGDGTKVIAGRLHSSYVFKMTPKVIVLSAHSYHTRTTADAMQDFCEAAGFNVGVSFAKSGHWVHWKHRSGLYVDDQFEHPVHAIKVEDMWGTHDIPVEAKETSPRLSFKSPRRLII